jgi:erythromycin esterase
MKRILFLIFCLSLSLFASSQSLWNEDYNKYLIPITTTDPNVETNDDLLKLNEIIGDKKIVALGEATHGTKEFVTTRYRLIKYLVTRHNFRVFVIEDNFTSTFKVDQLITGEVEGDIQSVMTKNWMGAWRNQEMVALMSWLKEFNSKRDKNDMVRVYGCDMTWFSLTAKQLMSELGAKKLLTSDIEKGLNSLMKYDKRKKMERTQKRVIYGMLDSLQSLFSNMDLGNDKSLKHLKLTARTLEQSLDYISTKGFMGMIKRDKYMAENCEHIFELENNKKMIVWAHNQHIANKSDNSAKPPMGQHLKKRFESDYFALGFAFYGGAYFAYNPAEKKSMACPAGEPNEKCIDIEFAKAQYPNFFIDFTNPTVVESMSKLLTKKVFSRSVGSLYFPVDNIRNYRKHVLSKSYDGLIFIRNTTAITHIPYLIQ